LFAFAKRTRLVFTNPARRLAVARHSDRQVLPMSDAEFAAAQHHRRPPPGPGRVRPRVLLDWLEHRRACWPRPANPYLLISRHTALGVEPVSHYYLKKHLQLRGVHLERIGGDRIVSEALVTGGDRCT
jgi:hypothetical protein